MLNDGYGIAAMIVKLFVCEDVTITLFGQSRRQLMLCPSTMNLLTSCLLHPLYSLIQNSSKQASPHPIPPQCLLLVPSRAEGSFTSGQATRAMSDRTAS